MLVLSRKDEERIFLLGESSEVIKVSKVRRYNSSAHILAFKWDDDEPYIDIHMKAGDNFKMDCGMKIYLTKVLGRQAYIGIEGCLGIQVFREELFWRIKEYSTQKG